MHRSRIALSLEHDPRPGVTSFAAVSPGARRSERTSVWWSTRAATVFAVTVQSEAERVAGTDERRSLVTPAILLGLGLGGFVDGIVLHQILQWHHMISSTEKGRIDTVGGLEANTFADGLFHAATWLLTIAGLWWLWKNASRRRITLDRQFLGWLIFGWGLFNVLDEVVFHALLDLHHIREGDNELTYDLGFSALGVAQLLVGWLFVRSGRKHFAEKL